MHDGGLNTGVMEKSTHSLQACLHAKRRTSLGSISSRKRNNNSMSYDVVAPSSSSSYHHPNYLKTATPQQQQHKLRPIAQGGSWDDNSVGYGSVVSRMRRDRHRAIIRRTQAGNSTYHTSTNNDTSSASVENTLNLINTTDLAPWHEDNPFGWDDDLADFYGQQAQTVATKRSAGSLCNISSPNRLIGEGGTYRPWDSQSIPESRRKLMREKLRNSFTTTGNHHHHSSPTSGCASIASSDTIDSASDFAFFSVDNDSSSFFDGDSLFSDSYGGGVLDGHGDSGCCFSTDIFSMLEDGSISCRTPFPAVTGDQWPDSISELNFDCSSESSQYQKSSNINNCDAHSDIIRPSSNTAAATTENRLKKRKLRPKSINRGGSGGGDLQKCGVFPDSSDNKIDEEVLLEDQRRQETEQIAAITQVLRRRQAGKLTPTVVDNKSATELTTTEVDLPCGDHNLDNLPTTTEQPPTEQQHSTSTTTVVHLTPTPTTTVVHLTPTPTTATADMHTAIIKLDLNLYGNDVTNVVINSVRAAKPPHHHLHDTTSPSLPSSQQYQLNHLKVDSPSSPALKKAFKVSTSVGGFPTPVRVPITLNLKGWNYMNKDEREGFIERLSHKISTTMSLEEQLDIIRIIEGEKSSSTTEQKQERNKQQPPPFRMSVDDIDSHKLIKLLGYLDTHKGATGGALNGLFSATSTTSRSRTQTTSGVVRNSAPTGGIRRSNSDGNLNISGMEKIKDQTTPRCPRGSKSVIGSSKSKMLVTSSSTSKPPPRSSSNLQRQRKECRQLMREQRSGLFINEEKMQISNKQTTTSSDEEICVDDDDDI